MGKATSLTAPQTALCSRPGANGRQLGRLGFGPLVPRLCKSASRSKSGFGQRKQVVAPYLADPFRGRDTRAAPRVSRGAGQVRHAWVPLAPSRRELPRRQAPVRPVQVLDARHRLGHGMEARRLRRVMSIQGAAPVRASTRVQELCASPGPEFANWFHLQLDRGNQTSSRTMRGITPCCRHFRENLSPV